MARRLLGALVATGLAASAFGAAAAGPATAATTTSRLQLGEPGAFAVLGHWCGGIQEKVYATGFAADGYPTGDVYLSTSCGGSGRDGGGKSTLYTAWAAVTWNWFAQTRSYSALGSGPEANPAFSAEDAHQDRVYDSSGAAFLETSERPLLPPAAPTNVSAYVSVVEVGENEEARFQVAWTPDPENAAMVTSSKVLATPIGSTAPALETTVEGGRSSAVLAPLAPRTTYRITVTSTDLEGTSASSTPIEVNSITPEEAAERTAEEPPVEAKEEPTAEPPVEKEEPAPKQPEPAGCASAQGSASASCDTALPIQLGNLQPEPSAGATGLASILPAADSAPHKTVDNGAHEQGRHMRRGRHKHRHRHR